MSRYLSVENVLDIGADAFFKDGEFESVPEECMVEVDGITASFVFHKDQLKYRNDDIRLILDELPLEFRDGCSFLRMVEDRNGDVWGDQRIAELLMCIGIAVDHIRILTPRASWPYLPGHVPYVKIDMILLN